MVPGDVLVPVSLSDGVAGSDAVLSAIGVRRMGRPTTVYSAGTANVLAAMRDAGVRRFVGPDDRKGAFDRYLLLPLLRRCGYPTTRRFQGRRPECPSAARRPGPRGGNPARIPRRLLQSGTARDRDHRPRVARER